MGDPIRSQETRAALAGLPAFTPAKKPATGELFAREVERASERARGDETTERRLDELASRKREARRASFGREREAEPESDVRAAEAHFRSTDAPVKTQPAAAAAPRGAHEHASMMEATSSAATALTGDAAASEAVSTSVTTPAAPGASTSAAVPALASAPARPAALDALSATAPRPSEAPPPEPLAVPRTQAASRAERPAAAQPAPGTSDPAVLEHASEVLRQIRLHLAAGAPGVRRLTLDLEPVELGRMAIQLALRGGKVHGIVRAERAETLALLQAQEPELLALLAERGVSADAVRFELGFGHARERSRGALPSSGASSATPPAPEILVSDPPRRSNGLVDTYA
jgi:hypothetical protein